LAKRTICCSQDLKRAADVSLGEAERLSDFGLSERQLNGLARLDWKAAAEPDIELQEQMCDALPALSKTNVGEVVMRTRLIGDDLAAQQNGESRIGLDDDVQLAPREGVTRAIERQRAE
jgi:hypothetical protein